MFQTYVPDYRSTYIPSYTNSVDYSQPTMDPGYTDYRKDIKEGVAAVKSEKERLSLEQIFAEIENKKYREIVDFEIVF